MNLAWRIYQRWGRQLAQAFPHEFKLAYGHDMIQLEDDIVEDIAKRGGAAGLIRLIADIAIRLPIEYLSEMRRDMQYASRALIKSPGFALVGIVSIGLGIGLTTYIYSAGWALLTRELPAANAKLLVTPEKPVSYYYIEQYRAQKNLFAGVAAIENGVPFNVGLQDQIDAKPERVFGQLVSPDYFSVLGVDAQHGRLLSAELDKPGDTSVVVVSDRFWRNSLNSDPNAVGQTLRLNGKNATIVGITPRNFEGALSISPAELFVPITVPASLAPELANDILHQRNAREFIALMRLTPGVTIDAAEAALDGITRRLDEQDPLAPPRTDKAKRVVLDPAGTRVPIPRNVRPAIIGFYAVLMGMVTMIACLNLATMLLARGANRRKELAIRLSVGASRFRLIRQMVSEGILLSLLGGAAGFALAYGLSVLNSQIRQPAGAPPAPDLAVDWHTAVFAFALAVVCGIGFSLAPALQATKTDVAPALKDGAALQLSGYRRFGLRNLAMGAQVAGSLMLLLTTGFLVLGFARSNRAETRFDPKTMVLASIDPVRDGYAPEKAQALFEKLPERLRNSGAVRSFALAAQPPFSVVDDDGDTQLTADGARDSSRVQKSAVRQTVGAGYFAVLNEPMLTGREFEEPDQQRQTQRSQTDGAKAGGTAAVVLPVVLNESLARGLFGDSSALGKRVRDDKQSYEVVGVVHNLKNGIGMTQSIYYVPLTQRDFALPPAGGITILARPDAGMDALSGIRSVVASIDPHLTLFNVQTLNEYLELNRYAVRFALRTYAGIGLFGLVLSAIGLAGVTAYAVAQRRKEIGIRMALGARKTQILRLVLREGAALITVGTVLGFLGAFAMAKILSAVTKEFSEAFKFGTNDPRLLVGAPLLLAAVALLACYVPARRAAKIDPLKALRQE
jgi:putative ABC transport system permease protein